MTIPGSISLNVAFFFSPAGLNTLHIILNGTIETFCVIILKFPIPILYRYISKSPEINRTLIYHNAIAKAELETSPYSGAFY